MMTAVSYRRMMRGPGKWFAAWFVFCAVLSLALAAVLAWAVIELVTRYAG